MNRINNFNLGWCQLAKIDQIWMENKQIWIPIHAFQKLRLQTDGRTIFFSKWSRWLWCLLQNFSSTSGTWPPESVTVPIPSFHVSVILKRSHWHHPQHQHQPIRQSPHNGFVSWTSEKEAHQRHQGDWKPHFPRSRSVCARFPGRW
jgi:hypothetical protein